MDKKIVLIDMDGVMADWVSEALYQTNKYLPKELHKTPADVTTYNVGDVYPGNEGYLSVSVTREGFYRNLPEISGSIAAAEEVLKMGHEAFLCSSPETKFPYQMCWSEKAKWVEARMGKKWVERLILTRDKTLVHGDVLLDDKPEITGVGPRSWIHLVYPTPYNVNTKEWRGGWNELFDYLKTGEKIDCRTV